MRIKRNTKKIIRGKGSKKILNKNLKKYVGGGMMFENGKLTAEAKEHLGVVLALAIAGASATALNAVIINKFPGTHEIIGNIVYSFARLIPVSLLESASAGSELAFHFCDKVSYIIKGMLSIIWRCRTFISGAVAIPVLKRIKDLADSISGTDIDEIALTKANTVIREVDYNNFFNTTFNLLVWVIENTYQRFENVVELCLNGNSAPIADNILTEIAVSDECERVVGADSLSNDEIKTAIGDVINETNVEKAKNVIDLNLNQIRDNHIENLKNRIEYLKQKINMPKMPTDQNTEAMDEADDLQDELSELEDELKRYDNLPRQYPFGSNEHSTVFDFNPTKRQRIEEEKEKIEGGKKNSQKRRKNVSKKHRK